MFHHYYLLKQGMWLKDLGTVVYSFRMPSSIYSVSECMLWILKGIYIRVKRNFLNPKAKQPRLGSASFHRNSRGRGLAMCPMAELREMLFQDFHCSHPIGCSRLQMCFWEYQRANRSATEVTYRNSRNFGLMRVIIEDCTVARKQNPV